MIEGDLFLIDDDLDILDWELLLVCGYLSTVGDDTDLNLESPSAWDLGDSSLLTGDSLFLSIDYFEALEWID